MKLKYISGLCIALLMSWSIQAQYTLPKYQQFKLKNGLTVYLMEQHEVPVINVSMIFPAGAIQDNHHSGLASLTAKALMYGTKSLSKQELDEKIDFLAAEVRTGATKEFSSLSASFAAKDKEVMLNYISQIVTTPAFDKTEFEKDKQRLLISLEQRKESPSSMIMSYFEKLIFGNHVYGNVTSGTGSSVKPLTIQDVVTFYHNNYFPTGSAIAIVGDFKSADMKKLVNKYLNSWKAKGNPQKISEQTIKPAQKAKVLLVNKDDARETTFYIGATGVSRNNPDVVAIEVVNTFFGGRFTSMLNDELRVNSGLTYGARSRFIQYRNSGTFLISSFTAKENSEKAISLAIEVLNRLHKNGLDDKSLASSKNYVKGQFPPDYETPGQLANLLTSMFWYKYNESFINNFEKNVDELTTEKSKLIINKYFPLNNLQIVMIGKADELKEFATKLGDVEIVQIKDDIR
jgi:predicted Zn-dependent peptidase